jgi:hypothetical protein
MGFSLLGTAAPAGAAAAAAAGRGVRRRTTAAVVVGAPVRIGIVVGPIAILR